jgi:hypothetical protein
VSDDHPVERHAARPQKALLLESVPGGRVRVCGDGDPGRLMRLRGRLHDPGDVVGDAGLIRHDLDHPGPDVGAGDASLKVAQKEVGKLVWPVDRPPGAAHLEVQGKGSLRIPARRRDEMDRRSSCHSGHGSDVAPEAGHGQIHDRPDAKCV